MNLHSIIVLGLSLSTAAFAGLAAYFWYKSSTQEPVCPEEPDASISDNPEQHILTALEAVYEMQAAVAESSRLNRLAAKWSAWAAAFAALTAFVGAV